MSAFFYLNSYFLACKEILRTLKRVMKLQVVKEEKTISPDATTQLQDNIIWMILHQHTEEYLFLYLRVWNLSVNLKGDIWHLNHCMDNEHFVETLKNVWQIINKIIHLLFHYCVSVPRRKSQCFRIWKEFDWLEP